MKDNQTTRSFSSAIERFAQFIRTQVKRHESRHTFSSPSLSASFTNTFEQLARTLRAQAARFKLTKKRPKKKKR